MSRCREPEAAGDKALVRQRRDRLAGGYFCKAKKLTMFDDGLRTER